MSTLPEQPTQGPRVLLVAGTRPELIKLAPMAPALEALGATVSCCDGAQHQGLMRGLWQWFKLTPQHTLKPTPPGPRLATQLSHTLLQVSALLSSQPFDVMLVQGDTSTALGAALAAFYAGVPVVHLEAGLRTDDPMSPWPEEAHRRAIAPLATLHLAPSERAAASLLSEGNAPSTIKVIGNTVIDALMQTASRAALPAPTSLELPESLRVVLGKGAPYVIATAHRRESFAQGASSPVILALAQLIACCPQLHWVVPVHPNPSVSAATIAALGAAPNLTLIEPQPYPAFVSLLKGARAVITDSGGLQEEAPALRVPTLVLRDHTEREEVRAQGASVLLGASDAPKIVAAAARILNDPQALERLSQGAWPYGQGDAARLGAHAIIEAWRSRWSGA